MRILINDTVIADDSATCRIGTKLTRSASGALQEKTITYTIDGKVYASTAAALIAGAQAIEDLADHTHLDFKLDYGENGPTVVHIDENDCTSGPYVVSVDYPEGGGPEWAPGAWRSWQLVIECVIKTKVDADTGVSPDTFNETVSIWGGGPRTQFVEVLDAAPAGAFQLCPQTLVQATQTGSASSTEDYPDAPDPIWQEGADIIMTPPRIDKAHDTQGAVENFTITWSYEFTARIPLEGEPS